MEGLESWLQRWNFRSHSFPQLPRSTLEMSPTWPTWFCLAIPLSFLPPRIISWSTCHFYFPQSEWSFFLILKCNHITFCFKSLHVSPVPAVWSPKFLTCNKSPFTTTSSEPLLQQPLSFTVFLFSCSSVNWHCTNRLHCPHCWPNGHCPSPVPQTARLLLVSPRLTWFISRKLFLS